MSNGQLDMCVFVCDSVQCFPTCVRSGRGGGVGDGEFSVNLVS